MQVPSSAGSMVRNCVVWYRHAAFTLWDTDAGSLAQSGSTQECVFGCTRTRGRSSCMIHECLQEASEVQSISTGDFHIVAHMPVTYYGCWSRKMLE
jgi:hypothetical protein